MNYTQKIETITTDAGLKLTPEHTFFVDEEAPHFQAFRYRIARYPKTETDFGLISGYSVHHDVLSNEELIVEADATDQDTYEAFQALGVELTKCQQELDISGAAMASFSSILYVQDIDVHPDEFPHIYTEVVATLLVLFRPDLILVDPMTRHEPVDDSDNTEVLKALGLHPMTGGRRYLWGWLPGRSELVMANYDYETLNDD